MVIIHPITELLPRYRNNNGQVKTTLAVPVVYGIVVYGGVVYGVVVYGGPRSKAVV